MAGGAVGLPRDTNRVQCLPAVPSSPRVARRSVAAALAEWGCDHLAEAAQLLVSELVTNAVVHAGTDIELRTVFDGRFVRIEVHDGANDFPALQPADPEAARGRGVGLVDALASRWGGGATSAGKVVWFELDSAR